MLKKSLLLLTLGLVCTLGTAQSPLGKEGKNLRTYQSDKKEAGEKEGDEEQKDDKDENKEEKEEQGYDKLIKKAKKTRRGVIDLHLIDGKVYLEIPINLMGREMLIGSTVTQTSDNGHGIVGSKPQDPLHVTFSMENEKVQMRSVSTLYLPDGDTMAEALKTSMSPAILLNMKIEAYNPDSTKVVVDMTDFFVSDNDLMSPFDNAGLYSAFKLNKSLKRDMSYIKDIKAFEDNVSISSVLSYTYGLSTRKGNTVVKDAPFTTEMTRSIILLPEKMYQPRFADYRIGLFFTSRFLLSSDPNQEGRRYFVNRWDIQPKDSTAYRRGELVEPVKPIVFYIDNTFPEWWKPYIKEGITQWNEVFEEIGFKNVVQVKDFPLNDPSFDPDNLKYSCVRYAPISIQNAMGPSWMDPRTGEIITASVYIYHDVIKLLGDWLFVQTAQADPGVRGYDIPKEKLGDALRYVISHEVGHCLGLMHNMGASHTIPVDSLRSPSFTQKYGTTHSIMDYARFNYVAQPGDMERGVKLTPPRFGKYDKYALSWAYKPILDAKTPEEDAVISSKIISEAIARDTTFRYGKQQFGGIVDPRAQSEDLGNDAIRATKYGIKNLKYILANMHTWMDDRDDDYKKISERYNGILRQYMLYLTHVSGNIGGSYMNEVKSGDTMPRYAPLSRAKQKEALKYLFEMYDDVDWLDSAKVRERMSLTGSVANSFRSMIFLHIMNSLLMVSSYEYLGDDPFTFEEQMDMLYDFVWNSKYDKKLTNARYKLQEQYVDIMLRLGQFGGGQSGNRRALISSEADDKLLKDAGVIPTISCSCAHGASHGEVSGFEWIPDNRYLTSSITPAHIYGYLIKAKKHLAFKKSFSSGEAKAHYTLLYKTLENALN